MSLCRQIRGTSGEGGCTRRWAAKEAGPDAAPVGWFYFARMGRGGGKYHMMYRMKEVILIG